MHVSGGDFIFLFGYWDGVFTYAMLGVPAGMAKVRFITTSGQYFVHPLFYKCKAKGLNSRGDYLTQINSINNR